MTGPLTPEQIENWRRLLSMTLGSYAFIMPVEEVQKLRDKMQEDADSLEVDDEGRVR